MRTPKPANKSPLETTRREEAQHLVQAKSADKDAVKLVREVGLDYASVVELGASFLDPDDWELGYRRLLDTADLFLERLLALPAPTCLLCYEKEPTQWHCPLIADFLVRWGWAVEHIF